MTGPRKSAAWPLLAVLAWLAFTAWLRPLAVPDEGRYAGVAWGMVTSGDWLVPHLNGLPYFHKPPLFYWITAIPMQWFGPQAWVARLAPWMGASAAAAALWLFARRWRGEGFARMALLAFGTQALVFVGAQFANLDMLVAGCITASVLALAHAALARDAGEARHVPALAAGYLFLALGVLAKGLIGVVLPGMVLVAWLLALRKWRVLLSLAWWPGMALFAVVALPWFALMERRFPDFLHYFFYVQHFARFAQGGFNNQQPWYFFPAVLLLLACPWSLWMLRGIARKDDADRTEPAATMRVLAWTWLALVTLFFSMPQSKLVGYILPGSAALALLAADACLQAGRPLLRRASVALAVVLCLGAVAVGALQPGNAMREISRALERSAPADRVVFVEQYWFDVPVYARLVHPVLVLDAWDPAADVRDNWHRELSDAAVFDPALGHELLIGPERWADALCTAAATWVVGDRNAVEKHPVLAANRPAVLEGRKRLWVLPALKAGVSRPGCPEMPTSNSTDKS
ncbi:ArnT family glycosyltransferase [Caenimonas aquaedulcis]|uniref:Glycosyltransferase family 39 protein n=1 Tax=Caenimonas aquaedulcis TaxID=2793270 RepID=A0A931H829_9BURK|nr:glycosyltransferase family 39 protein [Caenimonas aquaedulcis]MBG9390060.1 glycosyltransferase family 39 protein [Caenimonas aquaedulcis]